VWTTVKGISSVYQTVGTFRASLPFHGDPRNGLLNKLQASLVAGPRNQLQRSRRSLNSCGGFVLVDAQQRREFANDLEVVL